MWPLSPDEADAYLVWMLDVDAEAELFQQASFCFDHFVLSIDVHLVDHQRPNDARRGDWNTLNENQRAPTCRTGLV